MKPIRREYFFWYRIYIGRNYTSQKAVKNFLLHRWNRKRAVKSLIAQRYTVSTSKAVVESVIKSLDCERSLLIENNTGYVQVNVTTII